MWYMYSVADDDKLAGDVSVAFLCYFEILTRRSPSKSDTTLNCSFHQLPAIFKIWLSYLHVNNYFSNASMIGHYF